jgi:hypothetical protein
LDVDIAQRLGQQGAGPACKPFWWRFVQQPQNPLAGGFRIDWLLARPRLVFQPFKAMVGITMPPKSDNPRLYPNFLGYRPGAAPGRRQQNYDRRTRRLRAVGIRDKPTAPASPWQNGFVERLIGSIRRECVDHIVFLGEAHLRRILKSYARYYNETRTHLALDKDAPASRPVQRTGVVRSLAILGGLHHRYARA